MERLPIFVDLRGRPVLLLGDGLAAEAKRRLIEGAGGLVVDTVASDVRLAFVALDGEAAADQADRLRGQGLLVNVVDRPDLCDFLVPAIVDRSPVVVAIGTGGASATLAKTLRERLEALLPSNVGVLARAIATSRARVAARLPSIDDRRRFWDRLLAPGAPLDPLLPAADVEAAIDAGLEAAAGVPDGVFAIRLTGEDPDDLTLRQLRALSQADTIFHPPDVPPAVLDRARRDAVRVVCDRLPDELPPGRSVALDVA
jgi:uroporphyrin-III C-methyltransferase/precorrin-2 dehydrogenase/sirohydrochlorin ferrochelatase